MESLPSYPSPMQGYGSSILSLTNPEKIIKDMELTFRGQRRTKSGDIEQIGQPLMNEQGINSVVGQVRSLMNQVAIMSNLKEREVDSLMVNLADTIVKDLMMNRINYNITLPVARDRILTIATNSAYMATKRAQNEGDRRFWKGSQQDITYRQESPKKDSVWNKLGVWG